MSYDDVRREVPLLHSVRGQAARCEKDGARDRGGPPPGESEGRQRDREADGVNGAGVPFRRGDAIDLRADLEHVQLANDRAYPSRSTCAGAASDGARIEQQRSMAASSEPREIAVRADRRQRRPRHRTRSSASRYCPLVLLDLRPRMIDGGHFLRGTNALDGAVASGLRLSWKACGRHAHGCEGRLGRMRPAAILAARWRRISEALDAGERVGGVGQGRHRRRQSNAARRLSYAACRGRLASRA